MSIAKKNIYAPIPVVTRGKSVLLGGDPKNGDNILYACGSNIVIRSLKNPLNADIYTEHSKECTVARYAPSGFYIASGDVAGNVRIWDTTQAEHPLKIELKVLSGPVLDIDWSDDSKRLAVVGDGKEKFGAVLMWDSGSSVGEITGHSKAINSVAFKPTRPYRLVTGSEDMAVNWFEGPPFKFKRGLDAGHQRFVNCVRFNADGSRFISVGSDKRGVVFEGKDGGKTGELAGEKDGGHTGGIYAVSWNKAGDKVLTASADKTAKIFDVTTGKCTTTFKFGNATEDQQLGCIWQGDHLVSMSLSGDLAILDPNNPEKPLRVIKGHNKFITSITYDHSNGSLLTGSYDAVVNKWDMNAGVPVGFGGKGHTNSVLQMHIDGGKLYTTAMDDSVRITELSSLQYGADKIATDGQPADLSVAKGGLAVVATVNGAQLLRGGKVVGSVKVPNCTAVAISADGRTVLVGTKEFKINVYSLEGDSLKLSHSLDHHRGALTRLSFSPDGSHWASADTNREIMVWEGAAAKEPKVRGWVFHNARVNDIAWSPDNVHLASVSLDQSIIVWNIKEPTVRLQTKNAHQGGVNSVRWIDASTLVTAGQDSAARTWTVKY
jgi:WD40 repeat protein